MAACWSGRHSRFQREHLKAALNSAAYMSEGKDPSRIVPCRTKGESGDRIIWRSGHQIIGFQYEIPLLPPFLCVSKTSGLIS
jgi:hypothetical protein